MNFRKSSDKEDYLARESHYADRSTPQARKNSFYMNRYREKLLGDNESTRLDIPSMTTNHLAIAVKHLEKLVKDLKDIKGANIPYNVKVMSFRSIITKVNHDLKLEKEKEVRVYNVTSKKTRNTTSSGSNQD
ncbi:MAG: hypothetical protein CMP92_00400 [Gammaproteobacteria bacterium]|nr:hypothetical protein [Gammaproteobacteria bacterium]|tara:strand:- start:972 stop:1367 length:396 start_codon:yes stop_codon:yes gene_type:complete